MKIKEALKKVRYILIPEKGHPVETTIARELLSWVAPGASIEPLPAADEKIHPGSVVLAVGSRKMAGWPESIREVFRERQKKSRDWAVLEMKEDDRFSLLSSKACFLYAAFSHLVEDLAEEGFRAGEERPFEISFPVEKSTFDLFLTQYARLIRSFNRESYIRDYARLGFTHIEVNGLATPFPYEHGVLGEFYPDFYTYCPALDQFVSSRLNEGIYPQDYLQANLNRFKENARLAVRYGLTPGLLCFEPRSVPEALFVRYPTLRGARVDHPFRSFKPRYSLALAHPVVKQHYEELLTKLMQEVPELEFMSVWSNDSGSGFEHTKSLYVGRNGGAYLIREWKDDDEIAREAAGNIASFYRLLRDTASKVNPCFRVITRLESFYGERRHLWPQLRDRIDVEVNSLLVAGWENNYPHPRYPDVQVLGSACHNTLFDKEKEPLDELRARGSECFFYHYFGTHTNHEPLLGIPFPWLTYEKLSASHKLGVSALAHIGGIQPAEKVPYAVNQEVFRAFQLNSNLDIDETVSRIAERFAGKSDAPFLVLSWRKIEEAIRNFMPLFLYSNYGTVWLRLYIRPLVPDIDRIPEEEREYYEKFMVSSVHNPNRVDLARDVLFELISKDYARLAVERIDRGVWKPLEEACELFRQKIADAERSGHLKEKKVFEDQYFRAKALRCHFRTLRNAAVWIYAVHHYLETANPAEKEECRTMLREMIDLEIQNSREFIELWEKSRVEWMIVSGSRETPFIYGENFAGLMEKKIVLMEKHKEDEPAIDPDFMFRVADNPYDDKNASQIP